MTTVLLDSHVVHWWSAEPDPADRLIYATALELGCQLVTKDQRLRQHPAARRVAVW
ncbi:MAG: PIN domain-containing protein [Actinomycetota bacterium]|nr:PIN domain-containing protein [Actinomycetota bacterium]